MIVSLIAVACTFAAGLWLIVGAVWPAPPNLAAAVQRLRQTGKPLPTPQLQPADETVGTRLGRWVVERARPLLLVDERTVSDLELLRRPIEVHAGTTVLAAVTGALAGPIVWAVAAMAGTRLPTVVPIWFLAVGALGGWFLPRITLRTAATSARADFRHALGAYLDLLVMLLAAQEGPESAMEIAARTGHGPAFDELRRAIRQARLSGDPVWDTLDQLGRRVDVVELREIAAAGSLAGESGAAVRKSLTAKARALRTAALSAAEATARQRSQAMFAPLVLMGFGFIVFLVYPLLTNLTIGGT